MRQVVVLPLALAVVALFPAAAVAGLGFTVQEGFASPTVELGSAKTSKLCDIGIHETASRPTREASHPPSRPQRRRLRAAGRTASARWSWREPAPPA